MRPAARSFVLLAALALASAALPAVALADPPPEVRAAATALFDDARRAMQANDYASACPKLEEAQRMDPGIGILFNLADCYEHVGRTASAWSSFREVAAEAASKGQADREKTARARAATLEPKLMKLRIVVAPDANVTGLEVARDGVNVAAPLWGTPIPADPGKHTIVVKAPGKEPWQTTVTLDQPGNAVTVTVVALADAKGAPAPAPSATPAPAPTPAGPAAAPADQPAPSSPRPWQKPLGLVVAGVGVVGLGVGTAFGFLAKSAFDESNQNAACDTQNHCDPGGKSKRDDAIAKGNVGTAIFIAGGVLAAGGVVLWLTAPSAPAKVGLVPGGVTGEVVF